METIAYIFCLSCQQRNRADAVICEFCGKPLESVSEAQPSTKDVTGDTKSFAEALLGMVHTTADGNNFMKFIFHLSRS